MVYVLGVAAPWFLPETRGKPLPDWPGERSQRSPQKDLRDTPALSRTEREGTGGGCNRLMRPGRAWRQRRSVQIAGCQHLAPPP